MAYPNLVIRQDTHPDELGKGEGIVYSRKNETLGLGFGCPKCGHVSTGKHRYNKEAQTLKPSIRCKCGYHGYLINGIFTDA